MLPVYVKLCNEGEGREGCERKQRAEDGEGEAEGLVASAEPCTLQNTLAPNAGQVVPSVKSCVITPDVEIVFHTHKLEYLSFCRTQRVQSLI